MAEAKEAAQAPAEKPAEKPAETPAEKPVAAKPATSTSRPTGVTIVSIVGIIIALLGILAGVALIGIGGMVATGTSIFTAIGGGAMVAGAIVLILAIISMIGYIMLFKMKKLGLIIVIVILRKID